MSADLPNDPAQLQAMLVEADKDRKELLEQNRLLELKVRKMQAQVHALMMQYFGRSSEKLDPNQLQFAIDTVMADDVLAGERGTLNGPYNVLLRSPEMGNLAQKFGASMRFHSNHTPS